MSWLERMAEEIPGFRHRRMMLEARDDYRKAELQRKRLDVLRRAAEACSNLGQIGFPGDDGGLWGSDAPGASERP